MILTLCFLLAVCPPGEYKDDVSASRCRACPMNSEALYTGSKECKCNEGYFRTASDPKSMPCTRQYPLFNPLITIQRNLYFQIGKSDNLCLDCINMCHTYTHTYTHYVCFILVRPTLYYHTCHYSLKFHFIF